LIAGLSDPEPLLRRGAAEALGSLGPLAKKALPALKKALSDQDKSVHAAAMKAIESIRGRATM
jgi:HEAT repeat protein